MKKNLCAIYNCNSKVLKEMEMNIGLDRTLNMILNNKVKYKKKCKKCYLALLCGWVNNQETDLEIKPFDDKCSNYLRYKLNLKNKLVKIKRFLWYNFWIEDKNILFWSKVWILNKFLFEDNNFLYLYFIKNEFKEWYRFNIVLYIKKEFLNKYFLLANNWKNLLLKDTRLLFKLGKLQSDINAEIVFYYDSLMDDKLFNKYVKKYLCNDEYLYFLDEMPISISNINLFVKLLNYFETKDKFIEKKQIFDDWTIINQFLIDDIPSIKGAVINLYDIKIRNIREFYKLEKKIKFWKNKVWNLILAAYDTTPKVINLINISDVILLERNFILSHGVIMAKLLKKLCIMNVKEVKSLKTGEIVEIDLIKKQILHRWYINF